PGRALSHYGTGDLGADRGQGHAFRLRTGYRWYRERRREIPERAEPQDSCRRGRSRRIDLYGLREDPPAARWGAIQSRRYRRRQDSDVAALGRHRRMGGRERQGRDADGTPPVQGRGAVRG